MNSIISSMNDILIDWKKEHDIFDSMYLSFCESNGFLCFRDFPLCKLEEHLQLVSAETTTESIEIHLNDNRSILISFIWSEDELPQIKSVSFNYFFIEEGIDIFP